MTKEQLDTVLQNDWNEFSKKPFPGILPDWFVPKFTNVVMEVKQNALKYRADQLHSILTKQPNELSIDEVGMMINALLDVEPFRLDKDIHRFIQMRIALDSIRQQVNKMQGTEVERLKRKEAALSKTVVDGRPLIQVP